MESHLHNSQRFGDTTSITKTNVFAQNNMIYVDDPAANSFRMKQESEEDNELKRAVAEDYKENFDSLVSCSFLPNFVDRTNNISIHELSYPIKKY